MIFAHAPTIMPAILGSRSAYAALLYGPLGLLHHSMVLRIRRRPARLLGSAEAIRDPQCWPSVPMLWRSQLHRCGNDAHAALSEPSGDELVKARDLIWRNAVGLRSRSHMPTNGLRMSRPYRIVARPAAPGRRAAQVSKTACSRPGSRTEARGLPRRTSILPGECVHSRRQRSNPLSHPRPGEGARQEPVLGLAAGFRRRPRPDEQSGRSARPPALSSIRIRGGFSPISTIRTSLARCSNGSASHTARRHSRVSFHAITTRRKGGR